MNKYFTATLTIAEEYHEIASAYLWDLKPSGIVFSEDKIIVYFEETLDNLDILIRTKLSEIVIPIHYDLLIESEDNQDWTEEYRKSLKPFEITEGVLVNPTDVSIEDYVGVQIRIIPKMSFGTGDHPTTSSCLIMLKDIIKGGEKVLDAGSGTAILSIASVLFGAKKSVAFDNDEWCFINGTENIKLNYLDDSIEIRHCTIEDIKENDFDIVVANINKHILFDISESLINRVKSSGYLIISGILKTDERQMLQFINLELKNKIILEDWLTLCFMK